MQVDNSLTKDYCRQQLQFNTPYSYDLTTEQQVSVTDNELKQHPVTRKLNKTTSLMDFLILTAKANKQIKLIHHNVSPHNRT